MFLQRWLKCPLILGIGSGTVYTVLLYIGAILYPQHSSKKGLYLKDVSLRPKTDQNTVSSSFFFMLRKQRERIVHPTSFDEFLTEIKQQLI